MELRELMANRLKVLEGTWLQKTLREAPIRPKYPFEVPETGSTLVSTSGIVGSYLPCHCLLFALYPTLVKGRTMGNSEDTKKAKQFERLYTTLLVLLVAILLLISILYTPRLWLVESGNCPDTYRYRCVLWSQIPA